MNMILYGICQGLLAVLYLAGVAAVKHAGSGKAAAPLFQA